MDVAEQKGVMTAKDLREQARTVIAAALADTSVTFELGNDAVGQRVDWALQILRLPVTLDATTHEID